MSAGGQHLNKPHQVQQIQQWLMSPVASHNVHHGQGSGILGDTSPVSMEENTFSDFTFAYGSLQQSQLMGLPDVGLGDHATPEFSQRHARGSNGPSVSQQGGTMSGMAGSVYGSEQSDRRASLELLDDGMGDEDSTEDPSLEDGGLDEFGLQGQGDGSDQLGKRTDEDDGSTPAWSELKTKAGKDRKRLPLACIACRRKKIRCSGEKPACKHCLRSRIPCVYKVTTRKAAPRTDYMAMLDKRLKRMEDRIIKIVPQSDPDAPSPISRAVIKPALLGRDALGKAPAKKRGAEDALGSDLENWAKAPGAKNTNAAANKGALVGDELDSEEKWLLREGFDALPTKEVQEHLSEVFFDNVYGQAYHLLHKPSYMRKLRNNTMPPVLVLSICAVAARFAAQPSHSPSTRTFLRGEEWASHARDICTRLYESPNMTVLTCLIILGLHEFGTCHGGRSWSLGGQAIRMAFALQLHKDLEHSPGKHGEKKPLSFIDREIRRRAMWACFLMDRFNSSGSDRPMFIKEESLQIPLPVNESCFQLDMPARTELLDGSLPQCDNADKASKPHEHMGAAAYTIRAIAVWGRIINYIHQGGKEIDAYPYWDRKSNFAKLVNQAEQVQRNLPVRLRYSTNNLTLHKTEKTPGQFLLMHLSIQQNMLFLHNTAAAWATLSGDQDVSPEFLARASAQTVAAANAISEILQDAEEAQCNVTAPFAGYCAFSATSVHLYCILSGDASMKTTAEVNAGINIKFLRRTMRYWGTFHWMVENIRAQYRSALESSNFGNLRVQGLGAWPVLQYADWFNRYPHGVPEAEVVEHPCQREERGDDAVLEQKPELQSIEEFFTNLASGSPSSTEDRSASQASGTANKRRRFNGKVNEAIGDKTTHKSGEAAVGHSPAQTTAERHTARMPRRQSSISLSAPGRSGYATVNLSSAEAQPYQVVSPLSPLQASAFSRQGPGQQPAFFATDMPLVSNLRPQGEDLRQAMEQQQHSFAYPLSSQLGVLVDPSNPVWHRKPIAGGSKAPGQQVHNTIGMSVQQQALERRRHSQGQIGAESLSGFSGSDLPAGWFMPFSMDSRGAAQDVRFLMGGEAGESAAAGLGIGMDPFGNVFNSSGGSSNGIALNQAMDSLQHS